MTWQVKETRRCGFFGNFKGCSEDKSKHLQKEQVQTLRCLQWKCMGPALLKFTSKNFTMIGNCLLHTWTAGRNIDVPVGIQPCKWLQGFASAEELAVVCGQAVEGVSVPQRCSIMQLYFSERLWGCIRFATAVCWNHEAAWDGEKSLSETNSPPPYLSTRALLLSSAKVCTVKCG